MRWYAPDGKSFVGKNPLGLFFIGWFNNWGEIIDEWSDGGVALVKVDVPHQAWNYDKEDRWSLSIRWSTYLTWEETIDWFTHNF